MVYYCGTCGTRLAEQRIKTGDEDTKTGTTKKIHYKVLIIKTIRRYVCPNGCELETVRQFDRL